MGREEIGRKKEDTAAGALLGGAVATRGGCGISSSKENCHPLPVAPLFAAWVHPLASVGASNPNGTHNKMLVRGTNEKIVRATHSHPFL